MNLLKKRKDGGPKSPVDVYFLCEFKSLFTIGLLKFNKGGREAFHSHAFDAYTWFLSGDLIEEDVDGTLYSYTKSFKPKTTLKSKMHRVKANKDSWCLTIRGPWVDTWQEYHETTDTKTTLTHGRKVVNIE